jgi:hypothetical protein
LPQIRDHREAIAVPFAMPTINELAAWRQAEEGSRLLLRGPGARLPGSTCRAKTESRHDQALDRVHQRRPRVAYEERKALRW